MQRFDLRHLPAAIWSAVVGSRVEPCNTLSQRSPHGGSSYEADKPKISAYVASQKRVTVCQQAATDMAGTRVRITRTLTNSGHYFWP